MFKKFSLYKPSKYSILLDVLVLALCIFVVLKFLPFTTSNPFKKYDISSLIYFSIWLITSYFLGRYKQLHLQKYVKTSFNLLYATIITFMTMWVITIAFFDKNFSINVLFTFTTAIFAVNASIHLLYYAVLYAVSYEEQHFENDHRVNATVKQATRLDSESYVELCNVIKEYTSVQVLEELKANFDLQSGNTYVGFSDSIDEIKAKPKYKFSTIIDLNLLNDLKGINKLFATVNTKLPDNGIFMCRFETKSTFKSKILKRYPKFLSYIVYSAVFFTKRFLPKIFITRRIYYNITRGKNRILSKTEVLGRLYLCGFEVIHEKKMGGYTYITAQRIHEPEKNLQRFYGPFIMLNRIGKNGKKFNVYKFRTMHPYSEFLQAYIYNKNSLQDGGKFKRDIRVTTLGRIMRKYWLDELPMVINFFQGNMKIVGVRPISAHYFSLYSQELQELRVRFKPGLLPPFYADMPKTLSEIEASELKYLYLCQEKGTLKTDIKYLALILKNIFFNKARSA